MGMPQIPTGGGLAFLERVGTAAPARLGGRVVPDETLPLGVGLPPGGSPSAPITFGTMAHAAIWAEAESAPQRGTAGRFRLLEAPVVPSGLTDPPSGAAELSVIMQAGLAPLARRVLGCSEEVSLVQPWVDADLSEMTTLPAGEGLSRDRPVRGGSDPLRVGCKALLACAAAARLEEYARQEGGAQLRGVRRVLLERIDPSTRRVPAVTAQTFAGWQRSHLREVGVHPRLPM